MHLLLNFLISFFLMQITSCSACFDAERTALLAFKSKLKDPTNILSTWKGQNCCSWKGITCHNQSGHVLKLNLRYRYIDPTNNVVPLNGEIDQSLVSLRNLTHLDLSGNNFNETRIPNFIGEFENLVYLNLSSTKFLGKIPTEIGSLTRLRFLDMSNTLVNGSIPPQLGNISTLSFLSLSYSHWLEIENIEWIGKLNSLQHLDLTNLNLSSSTDWFHAVNKLSNLKVLILSSCDLTKIPRRVDSLNLTSLTTLDLSSNGLEFPVPSWLENLISLSYLDLSYSGLFGLSNEFWSNSKERFCRFRYLGLSMLNITGDFTTFVRKFACSWRIIEGLLLANNHLTGNLPTGWLREMPNLTHLDLSDNQLEGIISENHLERLTKLQVLGLSLNMFKVTIDHHWVPKFQLTTLSLQSCHVGPSFPSWLRSQTQMQYLHLRNSSINDVIPAWFWRPSYVDIDLSHNNLNGKLPHNLQLPNLIYLILASNNLGGRIKFMPNNLKFLDISNNKFSGTMLWVSNLSWLSTLSVRNNSFIGVIPTSICEMFALSALDMSRNKFSGMIPNCVSKLDRLEILDMSFNNLSGTIPNSICPIANSLKTLALHDNTLIGEIPRNLQSCKHLEVLDLGKNKLTGKVPKWIGESLEKLGYLRLRENNFHGNIPSELALLKFLQVLDIACNNLEGSIPDSFGEFSAMMSKSNDIYSLLGYDFGFCYLGPYISYADTMEVIIKGEIMEYSKNLRLMNSIDLSDNNLSGFLPNGMVALKALVNLNLSRNNLKGKIPEKISNIKLLESLDLSFNKFSGEIPQSMSELTFLSHLNLSYNNLSGPIPAGNQLNTFHDYYIFIGNAFLCGDPMNLSCSVGPKILHISDEKNNNSHNLQLYLSIGAGFVVGWWLVWCILLFHDTWSAVFFEKVDYFYYK